MASRRKSFERPSNRKHLPDTPQFNYATFIEALIKSQITATALIDSNPRAMQFDDPNG